MHTRLFRNLACASLIAVLTACGAQPGVFTDSAGQRPVTRPDAGRLPLPGTPALATGARNIPDAGAGIPLPKSAARAGEDFASNRFIAIFEHQPQSQATAPFLDGDAPGAGSDAIAPSDNAPLVQHPYLRKVTTNLAAKYGLNLAGRVFYKDVDFAVFELPGVQSVTQLDAMMLKVLHENPGLVREVCYDYYARAVGGPSQPAGPLPKSLRAMPQRYPIAAKTAARNTSRRASAAPPYGDPDPFCLNQQGLNTDLGDGAGDSGTWALWRMGATLEQGWSYTTGSRATVIAVVDTGVRYTHEDLAGNCIDPQAGPPYNAPGILTDVCNKDNDPLDDHGHGTFCAGEIAAKGNNGKGLAGVCWDVSLLPIKVLDSTGQGSDAQIAEGMLLADRLGANILSLSLGSLFGLRALQLAVKQCTTDGLLVCAAATNYNVSTPFYPAYYPECLAVGATTLVNDSGNEDFSNIGGALPMDTRFDARASFSNYGPWVDIAAPGTVVLSTYISSDTAYFAPAHGTSMATPYVAGCAGLLWSYISNPTNDKVRGLLLAGATRLEHLNLGADPHGFIDDTTNGAVGCVNVYRALQLYAGGGGSAPSVAWDNPLDGAGASGGVELRVAVSGGLGVISKVEFETPFRLLGVQTVSSGGFYRQEWDSAYEFNRPVELRAKAYDANGGIGSASITVTPGNSRKTPNTWSESFDGLADDAIPSGWWVLDGNQGGGNTSWGADASQFAAAAPSMHTSGSAANYAGGSSDWLVAPVIDLQNYAKATLSFQRRFQLPAPASVYLLFTSDDVNYVHPQFQDAGLQDWAPYSYNLAGYAGKEVRVIWALDAVDAGSSAGMWIDDLNLTAASGTPPTITIDSPANGASVSGLVAIDVTVSDDTQWISFNAEPPDLGQRLFGPIPDNDPTHPTKTYRIDWDSRYIYNGGALLTLIAYDDENGDGNRNDLTARAQATVSVTNPTRDPEWLEGFEGISTLGGFKGGDFDGDWYVMGSSTNHWNVTAVPGQSHSGSQGCKFGPPGAGDYGANELGLLYSPVHDCRTATHPYLRFWQRLDVEDSGNGDVAKLSLVQYDGLDDVSLPISQLAADTTPAGQWQEVDLNLEPWKARPLRFCFLFDSDNDASAGAGWMIDDYEIVDADPHIDSLSPAAGPADGQAQVTINGLRFGGVQGGSSATFAQAGGGRATAEVVSWSDTRVVVKVPAGAVSGAVVIDVLGYGSNSKSYTVAPYAISFTGIDPLRLYGPQDTAVALAVTASSGIQRVEVWVDGVKYGASAAAPGFAGLALDMARVPNGRRDVTVRGYAGANSVVSAPAPLQVYSLRGDINGDGAVGAGDAAQLEIHIGALRGLPGYEAWYDPDGDGLVTEADLSYIGYHWGEALHAP